MSSDRQFTIVDFLFSCVAVISLISVIHMTPGCGADRSAARQMQNTAHLRGIHSGCVLFGQGNQDFYPGLTANAEEVTDPTNAGAVTFGTRSTGGYDPAYRYTQLLRGSYFSPEYALSPLEPAGAKIEAERGDNITSDHFSFAMLCLSDPAGVRREYAWRSNNSATQAVLSDRNIGSGGGAAAASLHSAPWTGTVVYNDGHAVFEKSNIVMTDFERDAGSNLTPDDLFADDKDNKDAAMVYHDATSYVNQK